MHLCKEHIVELAREGANLTDEERLHLKECDDCAAVFRMFVLHHFYMQRTLQGGLVECYS